MSAPNTNLEKEEKRHKGPLIGMALAAVFGVGLILVLTFMQSADGNEPDEAPKLETTTGDIEQPAAEADPVAAPEQLPAAGN